MSSATNKIAQDLLSKYQGSPIIREQFLDANQLQCLGLTLNRHHLYRDRPVNAKPPASDTPIPPGYHLVYFTPTASSDELATDGTDIAYSPKTPFIRRMWAGGEIVWDKENWLRVGQDVVETTQLLSAVPKVTRLGEEMIVVGVQKKFENSRGVAVVERRDWVFRKERPKAQAVFDAHVHDSVTLPVARNSTIKTRDFLQTPVSLFHFSALTFNAHKIHYSQTWCRQIEGHRDIVVHGPLNLINMLDFWRDTRNGGDCEVPKSIRYRATAPFYCDEPYRAMLEEGENGSIQIKLWGSDGKGDVRVGMIGDLVAMSD